MKRFLNWIAVALLSSPVVFFGEDSGMVLIEPDSFPRGISMGRYGAVGEAFPLANDAQFYGDSERPFHYCILTKPYYIAAKEVTVAQWKEFVAATNYKTEAEQSGEGIVGWSPSEYAESEDAPRWDEPRHDFVKAPEFTWRNPGFPQSDDHPVVGVSWNDAQAFCKWLSEKEGKTYRLPTEAEWERAARQEQGDYLFPWGDAYRNTIHQHANIGNVELEKARSLAAQRHWLLDINSEPEDGFVFTSPVGSFQPNEKGIFDLSGNVFEWCQDYFKHDFYEQWAPKSGPVPIAIDPVNLSEKNNADNELRVIRGGSWYTGPLAARNSARGFFDAPEAAAYIGFRVVREATAEEASAFTDLARQLETDLLSIESAGGKFSVLNQQGALSLGGITATESLLEAVARIPGLRRLQNIELNPWTAAAWNTVNTIEDLEVLEIRGDWNEPIDFSALGEQRRLHTLTFGSSSLTPENLEQLSSLSSLSVFSITRGHDLLADEDLQGLASNRKLTRISLSNSTLSGTFLRAFSDHPYLQTVHLRGAHSRDPNLRGWTVSGSEALVENLVQLRELRLSNVGCGDECLAPLRSLQHLQTLELSSCPNLTDEGIATLLAGLPTLSVLELHATRAGQQCAAATPTMHFLQRLAIEGGNLNDESLRAIARSKTLRELRLRDSTQQGSASFTEAGIGSLAAIPHLEKLDFELTFPAQSLMDRMAQFPSLEELTIPIEIADAENSDAFILMPKLKRLFLRTRDKEAFARAKQRIETANPDITVNRR